MLAQLHLIYTLAAKDIRLFLADRRGAALCFLVPIVLASAFGLIFNKGANPSGLPKLPLLIVAEGNGPLTTEIVQELLKSTRLEAELVSREEAQSRVSDRRPGVAIIFTEGFEELANWSPTSPESRKIRPTLQLLHNPLTHAEAQWAEGVLSEVIMKRLAKDKLSAILPSTSDSELSLPFKIEATSSVGAGPGGFNAYSHSFCGMTLQYLLFWGMESGLLLLRERQRSLWLRVRAAPVPLGTVLLGKAASTAFIAFLQVLSTFAFGYVVFGVQVTGSWLGFGLLTLGISLLTAATGLLVAAIGGTESRARSVCILVILGVSMLGGLWLPSFVLPGWARDLALSLPTTWAMRGLDSMTWQGRSLVAVLPHIAVIMAFTAAFLTIAVVRLLSSEARRRRGIV
jgi:ABC-2 type transport system permease protein